MSENAVEMTPAQKLKGIEYIGQMTTVPAGIYREAHDFVVGVIENRELCKNRKRCSGAQPSAWGPEGGMNLL